LKHYIASPIVNPGLPELLPWLQGLAFAQKSIQCDSIAESALTSAEAEYRHN